MRRTSGTCPTPRLSRGRRSGARPPRTRSSTSRTESPCATASRALHRRHALPAERLAGAQSALAGDELVPAARRGSHHDGLQQPCLLDRRLQLLERGRVHVLPRLERVGADLPHGQVDETSLALGLLAGGAEEGLEPTAEATAS